MIEAEACAEVRNFFENRKIFLGNIQRARHYIRETKEQIIEGLSMQAADYSKDIIQTGGGETMTGLVGRLQAEGKKGRYEESILNAIVDGWEEDLEWYDLQWLTLPKELNEIMALRYYECMSEVETAMAKHCDPTTVGRNVRKAILIIAQNLAVRCSVKSEHNQDVILDHELISAHIQ